MQPLTVDRLNDADSAITETHCVVYGCVSLVSSCELKVLLATKFAQQRTSVQTPHCHTRYCQSLPLVLDRLLFLTAFRYTDPVLFDLLVSIEPYSVTLILHTRSQYATWELEALSAVQTVIEHTVRNVNELLLLEDVAEWKMCQPELDVGRAMSTPGNPSSHSSAEDRARVIPASAPGAMQWLFPPGWFACRLVYTHSFQLHERLSPSDALDAIAAALVMLKVRNRTNQFVYREAITHAVFLLQFEEQHGGAKVPSSSPRGSSGNIVAPSETSSDRRQSASTVDVIADIPTTTDKDGANPKKGLSEETQPAAPPFRKVQLNVYGVRNIGSGIGRDLVSMLKHTIESATQIALADLLWRKASLKLMEDDTVFLKGGTRVHDTGVALPLFLQRVPAFHQYLRQILLQYLRPYLGPDVETPSALPRMSSTADAHSAAFPTALPAHLQEGMYILLLYVNGNAICLFCCQRWWTGMALHGSICW